MAHMSTWCGLLAAAAAEVDRCKMMQVAVSTGPDRILIFDNLLKPFGISSNQLIKRRNNDALNVAFRLSETLITLGISLTLNALLVSSALVAGWTLLVIVFVEVVWESVLDVVHHKLTLSFHLQAVIALILYFTFRANRAYQAAIDLGFWREDFLNERRIIFKSD